MENKKRRAARSAAEWRVVVRDWRESGLSAKRYAAEHAVTESSLWRWSRRAEEPKQAAAFSEVRVIGADAGASASVPRVSSRRASTRSRMDVTTPSGSVVRFYGDVDVAAFTAVMAVLDQC